MTGWRCIPCGSSNYGESPYCTSCGRSREAATDRERWERFFRVDAVIADIPCDDCGRTDGSHNPDVEH